MNRNAGKGGPLIVVDGMPLSGVGTLARALCLDLRITYDDYARSPEKMGSFESLKTIIHQADDGPLIAPRILVSPAVRMGESNEPFGGACLTPEEWSILDSMIARRNGRLLCLVDTPASIDARAQGMGRGYTRERLGRQLQAVNQALQCSAVAPKGSYILPQFIVPGTGERTPMYWRLVTAIRAQIEAAAPPKEQS